MKRVCWLVVALFMVLGACTKEETNMLKVPSGSILVLNWGDQGTTTFDSQNITSITATSIPSGWSVVDIDMYKGTITVQSPAEGTEDAVQSGTMTLKGYTPTGDTRSLDIFLAIVPQVDYTKSPANCYVATAPQTRYTFDPMVGGSSTTLETAEIKLLWQTNESLVKYVDFRDGIASFYIDEDEDNEGKVVPGNALIGAYNADGEIIWSWHIWVTNNNPAENTIALGGATVMNVNLGAECNSNASTDDDDILGSYGMYYQWGRKEPFVGPKEYDFEGNTNTILYDHRNYEVELNYVESTDTQGTVAWAAANPLALIKGVESNDYDWLYAQHDDELWAVDAKTEYDPCPYGWRIADASVYASLTLNSTYDEMTWEALQPLYGIMLTDGTADYFFTAQGRRNYLDCRLDIVNTNETLPVPWSGYYWTTTTDETLSTALYFNLNTNTRTWNGFDNSRPMQRANAMPVRCIRTL
ncbi:MAG: hypothetical protein J6V55_02265 [Alistipes sp.]|nr:hypothetical protein [Alistipes sp.]